MNATLKFEKERFDIFLINRFEMKLLNYPVGPNDIFIKGCLRVRFGSAIFGLYRRKMDSDFVFRGMYYKTYYGRNLLIFVIS